MAVSEAAKRVFNVALAETLESKGFQQVSDTNYVLKGEGIEWRVVFGPEFKDVPGSFREETGILVPEIDRLHALVKPQDGYFSYRLANTRYSGHFNESMIFTYLRGTEYEIDNSQHIEPCAIPEERGMGRREHWVTAGHDLEALGQRMDGYWRAHNSASPHLESRRQQGK